MVTSIRIPRTCLRAGTLVIAAACMVTLLPWHIGPAEAARSSKPKEIVVVGSKVTKEQGAGARPARAVLTIESDRFLTEQELATVRATVPELLDELCPTAREPEGETERAGCTTEELEDALTARVQAVLDDVERLDEVELSVHLALRRDGGATALGLLAPALLGAGALGRRGGSFPGLPPEAVTPARAALPPPRPAPPPGRAAPPR